MASSERPPARFEIPDLELEVAPRPPANRKLALESPQQKPGAGSGHFAFDELDDGFELETAQSSLGFDMEGPSAALAPRGESWPTGATPSRGELELDVAQVERLAAFGRPPSTLLLAPLYTYRVFMRRRALATSFRESERYLADCEARRDATLAELVRQTRAELQQRAAFAAGLSELARAEAAAGEHEQALSRANADVAAKLAEIEAGVATLGGQLADASAHKAERASQLAACEVSLKRAEARVKRAQIELRAVRDVAVQRAAASGQPTTGSVTLTSEEAARVAALEQQAHLLAGEVSVATAPYRSAADELRSAERAIAALEHTVREREQAKSALVRQARQELLAKGEKASVAGARLAAAFAELGRGVLRSRGGVPVSRELLERLTLRDSEVARATEQAELQARAARAYDRHRAKQGLAVMLVSACVLLVLIGYALA